MGKRKCKFLPSSSHGLKYDTTFTQPCDDHAEYIILFHYVETDLTSRSLPLFHLENTGQFSLSTPDVVTFVPELYVRFPTLLLLIIHSSVYDLCLMITKFSKNVEVCVTLKTKSLFQIYVIFQTVRKISFFLRHSKWVSVMQTRIVCINDIM